MEAIKYSVIIPTYNSGNYLERCLVSVINQIYKNFEIIIIDNNSSDTTIDIVNRYINIIPLRYFSINNHGIIALSRNFGIKNAKGSWIAFLDSDDWWHPNKLLEADKHTYNYDFVYHKLRFYCLKNGAIKFFHCCDSNDIDKSPYSKIISYGIAMTTSGVIVRKSILSSVKLFDTNKNLVGGEDLDLWIRIAKKGARFKYINSVLAYYMMSGDHHVTSHLTGIQLNHYLLERYSNCRNKPYWIYSSLFRLNFKGNTLKIKFKEFKILLKRIGFINIPSFTLFLIRRMLKRVVNKAL